MNACTGSRGIVSLILNLMVNFTPRLIYPWEIIPVCIIQEAAWTPEPVWTFRRRRKFLTPTRIRIPATTKLMLLGRFKSSDQELPYPIEDFYCYVYCIIWSPKVWVSDQQHTAPRVFQTKRPGKTLKEVAPVCLTSFPKCDK